MCKDIKAPEIAVKHGMTRLVFEDDFDSADTIDANATGEEGYKWYVRRPYGLGTVTPEDYTVKDSVLHLHEHHSMHNYGLATVDGKNGVGYTFNKGVLEFRARVPHYDQAMRSGKLPGGGGPAIWSFPREKIVDQPPYTPQWVETDWMEYWGDLELFPGGQYTITLHETIRAKKDGVVVPERAQNHSKADAPTVFNSDEEAAESFAWRRKTL